MNKLKSKRELLTEKLERTIIMYEDRMSHPSVQLNFERTLEMTFWSAYTHSLILSLVVLMMINDFKLNAPARIKSIVFKQFVKVQQTNKQTNKPDSQIVKY
jgi:hypothetical protein